MGRLVKIESPAFKFDKNKVVWAAIPLVWAIALTFISKSIVSNDAIMSSTSAEFGLPYLP